MEKQILEIVKDKDDFKNVVEIKENAKGEPSVSVKIRSDGTSKETVDEAVATYKHAKEELSK